MTLITRTIRTKHSAGAIDQRLSKHSMSLHYYDFIYVSDPTYSVDFLHEFRFIIRIPSPKHELHLDMILAEFAC